jgi:hypothetical protein
MKQKRSKAIDMRFYWILDGVAQNQFKILWKKGADNLTDYFTKHHPPTHHQRMRSQYLHQQECANKATNTTVAFTTTTALPTVLVLPHPTGRGFFETCIDVSMQ